MALFTPHFNQKSTNPIRVGVLFSTTGYRSSEELPIQQATLMAIDEINVSGGINGRKIITLIKDSESNPQSTFQQAEHLIINDKVEVVFGCWLTEDNEPMKELFAKHKALLITPFQYDDLKDSKNILFIGTTAYQQVPITVDFSYKNFGSRFFLIGSNTPSSHTINLLVRDHVQTIGGEIVGEFYLSPQENEMENIVKEILKTKPAAIFNSLAGKEMNQNLYKNLRLAGIKSSEIPTFSFNVDEKLLVDVNNPLDFAGNYATWNYFETIKTPANLEFISHLNQFSKRKVETNTDESAYVGVLLWAQAVRETNSTNLESIKVALSDMLIQAPEGPISMDVNSLLAWRYSRIGKIREDGQFDIVWQSPHPLRPIPFHLHQYQSQIKANERETDKINLESGVNR